MAGAAFVCCDRGVLYQIEYIAGFQAYVLYPLVAGDLVGDVSQGVWKFSLQCASLVSQPQVLKRIKKGSLYLFYIGIVWIEQW